MKLVLATKNKNKIDEIKALTRDIPVEILTLEDFPALVLPPEEARSFIENALEKARFVARSTGLTALADDSGLEVAGLGGRRTMKNS
jgi:inosine/xanthosine triphosphate pyrophosphatase family protein